MAANVYEGMFILDSNRFGRDPEAVSGQIPQMIEEAGGEVLVSRLWEERRLAYPIEGHRKGTYWLSLLPPRRQGTEGPRAEVPAERIDPPGVVPEGRPADRRHAGCPCPGRSDCPQRGALARRGREPSRWMPSGWMTADVAAAREAGGGSSAMLSR